MYESGSAPMDPYADAYSNPAPAVADRDPPPPRGRSRSRSPVRPGSHANGNGDARSYHRSPPPYRRRSPPPRRAHAPLQPNPSNVLGVFGLSIRTQERDLEDEFSRYGRVEKVTIVYDQRSDRSRGFGFIRMSTVEEATKCVENLNGIELNGRRIRVDYSVTDRPHASTPGEYMGHRRAGRDDRRERDDRRDPRDRDRDYGRRRDDRDKDRDRDNYGRDRDWRDRRSPPPSKGGRYSPDLRRRRSYSRSPPPRGVTPPPRSNGDRRDYDAPASSAPAPPSADAPRW